MPAERLVTSPKCLQKPAQIKSQTSIKPVWTFECEDEVRGGAIVQDGTLYVPSYDHNLYALDAGNGTFIWKYATQGGLPGKPAITETNYYVGSEDKSGCMPYPAGLAAGYGSMTDDGPFRGFAGDRTGPCLHRFG